MPRQTGNRSCDQKLLYFHVLSWAISRSPAWAAASGKERKSQDLPQKLLLTAQAPFDLGYQGCGEAQVLESLLQDLGGVLCLAAITCEALLRLQATALSGFGLLFGVSCRWGHDALLDAMWVYGGGRLSTCTCSLAWVRTGSPCVTCSQDFRLSFLNHLRYKGARTALPILTPSSARRIGIERGGDDL
jgi:hypothetical protein